MMAYLSKSKLPNKKYSVSIDGKTIHFGDSKYEDYTLHRDVKRLQKYILRNQKNQDWENPLTSGFWARWVLWNKPTIKESVKDVENRFKIKIKIV